VLKLLLLPQKSSKNVFFLFVFIFLAVLLFGGCSAVAEKAAEKKIEKETGSEVDINTEENKVEVETDEGKTEVQTGSDVKLPEGFPADFPVYKGRITAVLKSDYEGSQGYMITIETSGNLDSVSAWYEEELKKAGYNVQNTLKQTGMSSYVFKKKSPPIKGSVQIQDEDGKISIVIIITY
jgi:hypothetical protein